MKTVGEVLQLSTDFLKQRGVDHPRRQVEELLSHVLQLPRIELYLQFERPLDSKELDALRIYLKQRAQRMPWQYIVGVVEFLDCQLEVTPDVLIPRPETEIWVREVIRGLPPAPMVIWDICCGSGCIGIALKKKRPDCTVVLSDLSHQALEVAKKNAARQGVEVEFRQGDLLIPYRNLKADIVVCNPPYISEHDYKTLDPEVHQEPKVALIGGQTGFEFYQRLAQELPAYLKPGAQVYMEMGTGMGERIKDILLSSGWGFVTVFQDWSAHDRWVQCRVS